MENIGGVWEYLRLRDYLDRWSLISEKEKCSVAQEFGFHSPQDFYIVILANCIEIKSVNAELEKF